MAKTGRALSQTALVAEAPDAAIQDYFGLAAGVPEYTAAQLGPASIVLTRSYTPTWVYWIAVLFFPIGLIALMKKEIETLTITANKAPEGSRILISGMATAALAARVAAYANSEHYSHR